MHGRVEQFSWTVMTAYEGNEFLSSSTYTLLPNMSITPGKGKWFVSFTTFAAPSKVGGDNDNDIYIQLFVNGVGVPETERRMLAGGYDNGPGPTVTIKGLKACLAIYHHLNNLEDGQTVEIRWKAQTGGQLLFSQLALLKMGYQ